MIHYRDMSFCISQSCKNIDCHRNQRNIDKGHFNKVGLPLGQGNHKASCGMYIGDNPPPANPKAVA